MMDRPHIIYNKRTGKYVCWLKIMNRDGSQTETVMTADNILGPYTKVREGLRPLDMTPEILILRLRRTEKRIIILRGYTVRRSVRT